MRELLKNMVKQERLYGQMRTSARECNIRMKYWRMPLVLCPFVPFGIVSLCLHLFVLCPFFACLGIVSLFCVSWYCAPLFVSLGFRCCCCCFRYVCVFVCMCVSLCLRLLVLCPFICVPLHFASLCPLVLCPFISDPLHCAPLLMPLGIVQLYFHPYYCSLLFVPLGIVVPWYRASGIVPVCLCPRCCAHLLVLLGSLPTPHFLKSTVFE